MKLIVQPRDGLAPVLTAIRQARKEIHIVIFRLDRPEVEKALDAAVKRGVTVNALIARTNNGGQARLRKLEQKLLEAGAAVTRTADDFVRYHGKFMVIDRSELWLLGFNFTSPDTTHSRSFGVVTKSRREVQQALQLFDADRGRQPYEPASGHLVVSPETARASLSRFIHSAKKQLLVYDSKANDPGMLKLLSERAAKGVDVRVIGKVGKVSKNAAAITHEKYPGKRLHVRAMVRDGREAFIGSQSLRKLELDARREVGIIVTNGNIVREVMATFEEDWALTDAGRKAALAEKRDREDAEDEGEVLSA